MLLHGSYKFIHHLNLLGRYTKPPRRNLFNCIEEDMIDQRPWLCLGRGAESAQGGLYKVCSYSLCQHTSVL